MKTEQVKQRYVAFLRGINVGGHHKVPMADLRKELEQLGFVNIEIILNSGNLIFDTASEDLETLEEIISEKLENTFSFPIPIILRRSKTIQQLFNDAPFKNEKITTDIRLYVSLLKNDKATKIELPWSSLDNSYRILEINDNTILSVLDLSVSNTPKAMKALENFFGSEITTRNWKTIERIVKKL